MRTPDDGKGELPPESSSTVYGTTFMSNIYLIGFMGSGKTTVGRLLAQRLHWAFVDTDVQIESVTGRTIPELFARIGEAGFREIEHEVLRTVTGKTRQVVALGGGAPLRSDNWQMIRSTGRTVYLSVPIDVLWSRLRRVRDRPLIAGYTGEALRQRIAALLEQREPLYRRADIVIACAYHPPEVIVQMIVQRLHPFQTHVG